MNTWNENNVLGRVNESVNEFSLDELLRGLERLKFFNDDLKSVSFKVHSMPELDEDMRKNLAKFSGIFDELMNTVRKGYFQESKDYIIELRDFLKSDAGIEIIELFDFGDDPDENGFVSFLHSAEAID